MSPSKSIPEVSYGILHRELAATELEQAAEQIRNLGYAVVDSGYTREEMDRISQSFDDAHVQYMQRHGEEKLKRIDEHNTIRSMLTLPDSTFRRLAMNANLMSTLKLVMSGKFIINQQNGIINPPGKTYNQGAWHRDLPYQHFTSSRPLAINALFCVDDFTLENGATFVLPASHKTESFPSEAYMRRNALQVEAPAGSFIVLDCMLFHSGGFNTTDKVRRAINHVYNIPFFKQQIGIPANLSSVELTAEEKDVFGFNYVEPASVEQYLASRDRSKS